jgi:hypothetical protein
VHVAAPAALPRIGRLVVVDALFGARGRLVLAASRAAPSPGDSGSRPAPPTGLGSSQSGGGSSGAGGSGGGSGDQGDSPDDSSVSMDATIQSIDTHQRTLLVDPDDDVEFGSTATIVVPASMDITRFHVGDMGEFTLTQGPGASYTLQDAQIYSTGATGATKSDQAPDGAPAPAS